MKTTRTILVGATLTLVLSGCGLGPGLERSENRAPDNAAASSSATTTATPGAKDTQDAKGPRVAGCAFGEIPPVPMFTLPDLGMLDTSLAGFSIDVKTSVGTSPGLVVQPARCDKAGQGTSVRLRLPAAGA